MKNDDIFYDSLTKDGGGSDHRKVSPEQKQLINKKESRKSNNGNNCTKNVVVSNK
jgi:hypothetical protein